MEATSALIKTVRQLSPAQLLAMAPEDRSQIASVLDRARKDKIDARCAERVASFDAGPLYFLTRFTATENPQFKDQNLPFKAPFPRKSYFVPLFGAFLDATNCSTLFVPKSRTMMTSWGAMGFSFCMAQWHHEETVVQTASEDKCAHLIDYVRQLWDNQESWLKQRHPLTRRSAFELTWEGGGEVASIPSGQDKSRAYHPTTFVMDEAAYLPEGEACLNAVRPSGARIIAISSAHAGWFGDQCER